MSYGLTYTPYNTNLFLDARGINPDAAAFIAATGITGTTEVNAVNALVNGLQTDGLWSKMKAVYPFVTDNRNLLNYTEDLSNVAWTKSGVAVTTGQIDPNGGTNAFRVQGTTLPKALYQTPTLTTGQTYTLSFYVKRTGGTNQTFRLFGNNSSLSSDFTATDTWQRFTYTVVGTTATDFGITRDSSNNNYDVLVWHPQLELGSTATTYQQIATTQQAYIASQFKYNLKDPRDLDAAFRLVFNGGWTHSSTGATPNGTNGYADTKLNPLSVFGSGYAAQGSYYRETFTAAQTNIDGVCLLSTSQRFDMGYDNGVLVPFMAIGTSNSGLGVDTDNRRMVISSRQSISSVKMFRNNTLVTNSALSFATYPNFTYFVAARNEGGTPTLFSNSKSIAFKFISDSLTDTDISNLTSKVQAFQTSLSRQV